MSQDTNERSSHTGNPTSTNHCQAYLHMYWHPRVAHAYPLPTPISRDPLGRPVRLPSSPDSGGYLTRCRNDSATAGSPGNTPLGSTDSLCRANPLGHPAGAHAGRTFCDPRTSCGDTNGDTCTLVLYVFGCQNLAEIG